MIRLAFDSADIVVRDDYYKEGLAINESMARDQLASDLGISGNLLINADGVSLQINQSEQDFYQIPAISLTLHHPFDARQDLNILLEQLPIDGADYQQQYSAEISIPLQRWYLEITPLGREAVEIHQGWQNWRIQLEHDFRDTALVGFGYSSRDD